MSIKAVKVFCSDCLFSDNYSSEGFCYDWNCWNGLCPCSLDWIIFSL